jgi:4-aminobutyrate aminotransferase
MVVIGKGLGGGVFPMAALLARAGLDVAADRALGHYTHEKSSVGCAAALATIEVIESKHLLERANRLGAQALERLHEMKARFPAIVDVRGIGLLLAIEFKDADIAEEVMYCALANGLSFKVGQGNVIVLAPPLVIEERDLENALFIVEDAIAKTLNG